MSAMRDGARHVEWVTVAAAAQRLALAPVSLRRIIERNARRAPDGSVEASVDGIVARKVGRQWRVALGERWTKPAA